jgi:hypothetical protein
MKISLLKAFIFILVISLTGCLSIPTNDKSDSSTAYIKISGITTTPDIQLSYVLYGFYYVIPENAKNENDFFTIKSLGSGYQIKQNIKNGNFNEWLLLGQERNTANKAGNIYIVDKSDSGVTFKENCFTIMPFKVFYNLGKVVEGSSYYVNFKVNLVKLTENDIAGIIKDLQSDKNILTYDAIYLGNQDITDKIKNR